MEAAVSTEIAVIKKRRSGLVLVPACGHRMAGWQQGAQGRAMRSCGLHTHIIHELHMQRAVPPKHPQWYQEVPGLGSPWG